MQVNFTLLGMVAEENRGAVFPPCQGNAITSAEFKGYNLRC